MKIKNAFFTCLYRSPSKNCDQFSDFCKYFSIRHNNIIDHRPSCSVIFGDFNAKCSKWCSLDKNNAAGETLHTNTTNAGYSQLINKPTHCVNGNSSVINLVFASNRNLVWLYVFVMSRTRFRVNPVWPNGWVFV